MRRTPDDDHASCVIRTGEKIRLLVNAAKVEKAHVRQLRRFFRGWPLVRKKFGRERKHF